MKTKTGITNVTASSNAITNLKQIKNVKSVSDLILFVKTNFKLLLVIIIALIVIAATILLLTIRKYDPAKTATKTATNTSTITNESFFYSYPSLFKLFRKQTQQEFDNDLKQVLKAVKTERTPSNVKFFEETDVDITKQFHQLLPETNTFFGSLIMKAVAYNPFLFAIALFLKFFYNRARPFQVANIKPLHSTTSTLTPSYPSTHAMQAYALAKSLTKKYPEKANKINELAERIADIRRIGGVHFPSDKDFAKRIVRSVPII